MNLKYFVLVILSLFSITASAVIDSQKSTEKQEAKEQSVDVFTKTIPRKGDERSVIVFFNYTCQVCEQYHFSLENWSKTLPKSIFYQEIPVYDGTESSLGGIVGFWAIETSGNATVRSNFSSLMYQGGDFSIFENVEKNAVDSMADIRLFKKAVKKEFVSIDKRLSWQKHYKPKATPTMVICGKYMIDPEIVNGQQDMFFQLANALVSKCMMEEGIPAK